MASKWHPKKKCWRTVQNKVELLWELSWGGFWVLPKEAWMDHSWCWFPRKAGLTIPEGFWPISLAGGLYKLITKILVNWLRKFIGKVVLKWRQILDVILIVNKVTDSMVKISTLGVAWKLELRRHTTTLIGISCCQSWIEWVQAKIIGEGPCYLMEIQLVCFFS